jgi:hypothetical protein
VASKTVTVTLRALTDQYKAKMAEATASTRAFGASVLANAKTNQAGLWKPMWPYRALGYGAADWAHRSVKALADHVSDALGIVPNYRRMEAAGWEQAPGVRTI